VIDISDPENSYTGQSWFGVGPPLVIGAGVFVLGLVLMVFWRTRDTAFWQERPGVADEALAEAAAQRRERAPHGSAGEDR